MSKQQRSKQRHQQKRSINKSTRQKMRYEAHDAACRYRGKQRKEPGEDVQEGDVEVGQDVADELNPESQGKLGAERLAVSGQGSCSAVKAALAAQTAVDEKLPQPRPWCDHAPTPPTYRSSILRPQENSDPVKPPYFYG